MAHPYLAELHSQRWPDEQEEEEESPMSVVESKNSARAGSSRDEAADAGADAVEPFDSSCSEDTHELSTSASETSTTANAPGSSSCSTKISPREPQSEKRGDGAQQHQRRIVRRSRSGSSSGCKSPPPQTGGQPFSSGSDGQQQKKPSLLDHEDFHFEKLGPLGRMELQEIFMNEIARFHPELK